MYPKSQKFFEDKLNISDTRPYTNVVLFNPEHTQFFLKKIRNLPLIEDAKNHSNERLNLVVKKSLDDLNIQQGAGNPSIQQAMAYKIIFSQNFDERSFDLIKDYFSKIINQDDIVWGTLTDPEIVYRKSWHKYFDTIYWVSLWSFFLLAWCLIFEPILKLIKISSFLSQKYQRRKNIAVKTLIIYFVPMILMAVSIVRTPSAFSIFFAAVVGLLLINSIRLNIRSQN